MKNIFSFFTLLFIPIFSYGWDLQLEEDNIKIYTQDIEGSDFKAFRGTTKLNTSLTNLVAHHLDMKSMTSWLQDCTESKLVKQVSPHDFYVYQRTDAPWPVTDRDYVLHMQISQNKTDLSVLITFDATVDLNTHDKDCVPITHLKGHWKFTPESKDIISVEYETAADPAGDLPSWLANRFVLDQPLGTLRKLRNRVEQNHYELPAEINYIIEPTYKTP